MLKTTLPIAALALFAGAVPAFAQWTTESYSLKPGWNAIWLPLDVPHDAITQIAHAEIQELWRWNAQEAGHFTAAPNVPDAATLQWNVWRKGSSQDSTMAQLTGNAAYLVKVNPALTSPITWNVKGRPLPPSYDWSSTGLNLVGFPMVTPSGAPVAGHPRSFSRFLGFDSVLKSLVSSTATPLFYDGGELAASGAGRNPKVVTAKTSAPVVRGQAYWVQATSYTDYYGPLKIEVTSRDGLDFGTDQLSLTLRIKNVVDLTRNQTVTATIAPAVSESAPAGQPAVAGAVPLLVRGAVNLQTGVFAYNSLAAPITRVLAPGQETELILTVNRALLGNVPGAVYQSLLRVSDSLNQVRIDLPVAAETTSRAGLWNGVAVVTHVDRIQGSTSTPQQAPSQFPIHFALHQDAAGQVRLLQQAYLGEELGNDAISGRQAAFSDVKLIAARNSSSHYPKGLILPGTGMLGLGGTTAFDFTVGHDSPTHPFVHAYHPDHDNLDARFEQVLPAGKENQNIRRQMTLTFNAASPLGFLPEWGSSTLGGTFTESISGLRSQPIQCSGVFTLQRVSSAGTFLP